MIDYVKILVLSTDIQRLKNLNKLTFFREISESTGEYANKIVAEYHHCKITIFDSGIILFSGSIHKMHNSLNNIIAPNYKTQKSYKGYNGNQFKLVNILHVRIHLENLFDCKPHQMKFQNIEFGVNTEPFFKSNKFIKGLLYHNGVKFDYKYEYNYAESKHQQYRFKIYNKGNQYGMNTNTLRIELSFNRMKEVNGFGISTFADVNIENLAKAKQELLRRFDEIVYYDYTVNKKSLPSALRKKLIAYSNPRYWLVTLKSNHRDREKKKLKQIINDYSDNLQSQLRQEVIDKCVIINQLSKSRNV